MDGVPVKKTLIFNGSPRKKGDTAALIRALTEDLAGQYRVVDCYRADISPCIDCRSCRRERRCVLNDGMQEIYKYIEECDNVVVASPIYSAELTGRLLDVANRPAGTLPYGQQRRLEIARCMMTRPNLLMLDEPAAGLNPHETAELEQLIQWYKNENKMWKERYYQVKGGQN